MAEVNQAVADSSYTRSFISFSFFFLSLDLQHVPEKERMLNIPECHNMSYNQTDHSPTFLSQQWCQAQVHRSNQFVLQTVRLS